MATDPATATPAGLLDDYRAFPGTHDAMVDARGGLREPWTHVGRVLDELGHRELIHRRAEAARLLANDGVSYQIGTGTSAAAQRWELDPVPVLMSSAEWVDVERGVIQRAELLNHLLTDLYGPRRLVRHGVIPPELVFAHPGFLREVDGITIPGSQQLFNCAVDLARDADGQQWVLADRTQTPAGAGYALENRVVVSRVLPSMYRDAQVHRLAPFFRTLRTALQAAAPAADEPRIVVLTPGPYSETAFEHAYLASYLGYPLVEGADLTVREGRVWMRALDGMEPVDVILRRVEASYCDPLELRSESLLGVPGLVEACRLGTVSVVNTLGSGVLENPGLLPLLPMLCRRLLGEDLRLPSVRTWWCGEELGRRHVVSQLENLVVKSITRGQGASTVLGWTLSAEERDALRRRIEAQPHAWVGQDRLALASVPTLTDAGLVPRRAALRAFLVARHDSYAAMPGGLVRVASADATTFIAQQAGAVSKDAWVVASEPEDLGDFWLRSAGPVVTEATIPARAAENMFWLGRYTERAESVARLLRVVGDRRNDFPDGVDPAGTACLRALLGALTQVTDTGPGFLAESALDGEAGDGDGGTLDVGTELRALATDANRPGTLAFAVRRVRDAAYPVRDQLSGDTWFLLAALERDLLAPRAVYRPDTLARVLGNVLALQGLAAESMVRDQSWRFLDAGRRLERAIQMCALLRATVTRSVDTATDSLLLESVLTATESIITYRRRHRSHARLDTLLDLLLLDAENPRSVGYQLDRLAENVAAVAVRSGAALTAAERQVLETVAVLRTTDVAALVGDGPGERPELAAFLDRLSRLLHRVAVAVDATHFTHLLPQQPLAAAPGDAPHLRVV